MGEPEWLTDPRFADGLSRGENGPALSERMARWCAGRSTEAAVAARGAARTPCGPVLSAQQALDHPQVQAMGLLQPLDYPGLPRPAPVARVPLKLAEPQPVSTTRAPLLGEHSHQMLAGLGYSEMQIAALRAAGVV